jgi:hypothetical protein
LPDTPQVSQEKNMAIELYRNGKAATTKKRGLPNVASIAKKTVKKYNFEKLCIHTK